jgi:hypothetical protein
MSDTRGGRVTSSMIDIRYSAVAEFRGGQEDQVNLVNAPTVPVQRQIPFNASRYGRR